MEDAVNDRPIVPRYLLSLYVYDGGEMYSEMYPCETGEVAGARVTVWMIRYPNATVTERVEVDKETSATTIHIVVTSGVVK